MSQYNSMKIYHFPKPGTKATAHWEILEEHTLGSWPYEHFVKKKNHYGFVVNDFGFKSFMELEEAAIAWQGGVCALSGVSELWEPGSQKRSKGKKYRWFELDHDHSMYKGTLGSLRGYLSRSMNALLKPYDSITDISERKDYLKKWFGPHVIDYVMNPPLQKFLKEVDSREYNKRKRNGWKR